MRGEWHTELPDGREVVIRRRGEEWLIRCGHSQARNDDLEVALAEAIRGDTDVVGHGQEIVDHQAGLDARRAHARKR